MDYRFETYTVRTLHNDSVSGNAFIVPIVIQATSALEAAQIRFDKLSESAKPDCRAILVEKKSGYADPRLFEIEKITQPSYTVKPA